MLYQGVGKLQNIVQTRRHREVELDILYAVQSI